MKTFQYRYPFEKTIFTLPGNLAVLQIGIQRPWSTLLTESINFSTPIYINEHEYIITDKDILEFSNLNIKNLKIEIKEKMNPYLIVDIAYKTAD